ncbi:MAG: hybrid sensor histidine kinase/response regulator [Chloroflexi bacterium]|nr:hybrid sensor histidine kinase/response regulator [Chloroflexota bacterium]
MADLLLIDDNPNFRLGLAANLRKAGFSVAVAADGTEGIKLANEIHPGLILCDLKMPSPDGMEIKRILNEGKATEGIPFVFLSALSAPAIKSSGLSIGAEDYITKPVDIVELIARIQAILKRRERADLLARQEVRQLLDNLSTSLPIHTSHHFRTYLGVLLLSLEMIAKNQSPTDQYLEYARNSAYRMKIWMETLIWMNEYDLGRFPTVGEQVDLEYSFLIPIKEVFDIWHDKNLRLDFKLDNGLTIFTPARVFTQVVCHLVDNACKFSPEGGLVQVILQANGSAGCTLTIVDQGPGIPADKRETVFERFSQMPYDQGLPENHGMGLGLFMARSFARTQDGDVKILESDSGCNVQMVLKNKASHSK